MIIPQHTPVQNLSCLSLKAKELESAGRKHLSPVFHQPKMHGMNKVKRTNNDGKTYIK